MKNNFLPTYKTLQDQIVAGLEAVDGQAKFKEDLWERPEGGGGRTRVIENGKVLKRRCEYQFSVKLPEAMQKCLA
jgi:coproporphyrinogen III oxidase